MSYPAALALGIVFAAIAILAALLFAYLLVQRARLAFLRWRRDRHDAGEIRRRLEGIGRG